MKIILLTDIKKQGKKGQTITVKDGYGNYLINEKKAVMETTGSKKVLDNQNKEAKHQEQTNIKTNTELKNKLEKTTLKFKVKTGKNDQVFGSISTKQISEKLKELGYQIDKRKIKIETPINTLGTTNIKIELYKNITATIKINLTK